MVYSKIQFSSNPKVDSEMIRILIVEDEPAIAKYTANTLATCENYKVSGIAFSDKKAIQQLNDNKPDLVLLDVNLGCKLNGIDIAEIINRQFKIPFLFLTSHTSDDIVERAKLTRPLGYIVKPFSEMNLLTSLKIALFNFKHTNQQKGLSLKRINDHLLSPVSQREFDILKSIYEGKKNQEVAEMNYVSINTVKTHIRNILSKFNVSRRTELIAELRKIHS